MSSMAESVNHLLSAVTEGQLINSTATTQHTNSRSTSGKNRTKHDRNKKSSRTATEHEARGKIVKTKAGDIGSQETHLSRNGIASTSISPPRTNSRSRNRTVADIKSTRRQRSNERTAIETTIETVVKTASFAPTKHIKAPTTSASTKSNKFKRKATDTSNQTQSNSIFDSSDDDEQTVTSCIANRTRSKFHINSPLPRKKLKISTESTASVDVPKVNPTLGSHLRKVTNQSSTTTSDKSNPIPTTTASSSKRSSVGNNLVS